MLINKVFSTFPTTLARKTTSKDVLPPGRIFWRKKKDKQSKKFEVIALFRKTLSELQKMFICSLLNTEVRKSTDLKKSIHMCNENQNIILQLMSIAKLYSTIILG